MRECKDTALMIRDFPPPIKRKLKAIASMKGMKFQRFIIAILTKEADKYPTIKEV